MLVSVVGVFWRRAFRHRRVMLVIVVLVCVFGVPMRFALAAAMRVSAAFGDQGLVAVRVEFWELLDEGNHAPDVLVVHALTPGRHAGSLYSVFDHPEVVRRIAGSEFGERGRRRVQAPAQFGLVHARSQMTAG